MGAARHFHMGRAVMHHGDSRDVLKALPDSSLDSIVTDPPYALVSVVKRFGKAGAAPAKGDHSGGAYARASAGFMGQEWDTGETAFAVEFWAEVFRVLKPGGHVVGFSGTRTYHRLAVAIEDAGFEIRDQLGWLYGTGFPKSKDVGAKVPERAGYGTALKPGWEPIVLARKPLVGTVAANVLAYGTGAINVDGCRVAVDEGDDIFAKNPHTKGGFGHGNAAIYGDSKGAEAYDPTKGRHPANVIHDGSPEVVEAFDLYSKGSHRFFYSPKASKADRDGSTHPTVKPVNVMRWLCRLVTPPGGTILDPFAGSGTTLQAGLEEGFRVIGVEREESFFADCCRRLESRSGDPVPSTHPALAPPAPVDLPHPATLPAITHPSTSQVLPC